MPRAATLLLLLPLMACAARTGGLNAPDRHSGPITAHISPEPFALGGIGGASYTVYTDRPAYVAVFEIVPGHGVAMIHPRGARQSSYVPAGLHRLHDTTRRHRRAFSPASFGGFSYGAANEFRYIFLIASELPMELEPLAASPWVMHSALGSAQFATHPYRAMDSLVDIVLPFREWGGWTTDVYVQEPQSRRATPRLAQLWRITCSDGQTVNVPTTFLAIASSLCPDSTLVPPEDGAEVGPTPALLGQGYELRRPHPQLPTGIDAADPFGTAESARLESLRADLPESASGPEQARTPRLPRLEPPSTDAERPRLRRPGDGQPRIDPRERIRPPQPERPRIRAPRPERSRIERPRTMSRQSHRIHRRDPPSARSRDARVRRPSVRRDRDRDTGVRRPSRTRERTPRIDVGTRSSSSKSGGSGSSSSSGSGSSGSSGSGT